MMTNPRVRIGDNSADDGDTPADHDATVRHIVLELNKCRQQRRALGDDEREVKQSLKDKGLSPRAQAIARRARKSTKEDPADVLAKAASFIDGEEFADERAELDRVADEKREVSKRERELRAAAREKGVEVRALPIVRAMQEMDSIERGEYFDGIVAQCKALRFW